MPCVTKSRLRPVVVQAERLCAPTTIALNEFWTKIRISAEILFDEQFRWNSHSSELFRTEILALRLHLYCLCYHHPLQFAYLWVWYFAKDCESASLHAMLLFNIVFLIQKSSVPREKIFCNKNTNPSKSCLASCLASTQYKHKLYFPASTRCKTGAVFQCSTIVSSFAIKTRSKFRVTWIFWRPPRAENNCKRSLKLYIFVLRRAVGEKNATIFPDFCLQALVKPMRLYNPRVLQTLIRRMASYCGMYCFEVRWKRFTLEGVESLVKIRAFHWLWQD